MSTQTTMDGATLASRGRRAATPPEAPPLPAELELLLRRMRLPYLRAAAANELATAKAQRWDPAEVLRVLIDEEVIGRDAATRRMRRRTANFPAGKTFATWRPDESSILAPTQQALSTLEWIGRAEDFIVLLDAVDEFPAWRVCGGVGVGGLELVRDGHGVGLSRFVGRDVGSG